MREIKQKITKVFTSPLYITKKRLESVAAGKKAGTLRETDKQREIILDFCVLFFNYFM